MRPISQEKQGENNDTQRSESKVKSNNRQFGPALQK